MALADAVDDMRRYAARGRVGDGEPAAPRMRLNVTGTILRGQLAVVSWWATNAHETKIIILSPGAPPAELRVPSRGRRQLPGLAVGRHIVLLRVSGAGRRENGGVFEEAATIEVVHPQPAIEAVTPRRVVLGDVLRISWQVQDAQRAEILTPAGARPVELQGSYEMRPLKRGTVEVQLKATGPGGEVKRRFSVEVVAPPLVLDMPSKILAEPGEDIAIRYAVRGAAMLMLCTPDRDEPARPIPPKGRIEIEAVTQPERLIFNAFGHDGRKRSRTLSVNLAAMAETPIDDFLATLNGRW